MRMLRSAVFLAAGLGLLAGPGCETLDDIGSGSSTPRAGEFVQVDVPRPDDEGTVPVLIEKNKGDANHELAISRMQTAQYESAAGLLESGLADNKPLAEAGSSDRQKYMREHLALAVCHEMLGRESEAHDHYVRANDCRSDDRAQAGARRCAEKLGL